VTQKEDEGEAESALRALAEESALRIEGNFLARSEARDRLESGILPRLEGRDAGSGSESARAGWRSQADALVALWDGLDEALFRRLRTALRAAADPGAAFREMLETFVPRPACGLAAGPGYDARDAFLNGLLHPDPMPEPVRPLEADMVPFQKTPFRAIEALLGRAGLGPADVFCDVGSGLGQIPIVVHLLSGARAWGCEREPAYVAYARACADALGLSAVAFAEADARAADYAAATALFLYTPFRRAMLDEVLERMRRQCRPGARIFAYGPCLPEMARKPWLTPLGPIAADGLAGFAIA
jgi:precorrin-6B methylase 2